MTNHQSFLRTLGAAVLVNLGLAGCAGNIAYRSGDSAEPTVCAGSVDRCHAHIWQRLEWATPLPTEPGRQAIEPNPVHLGFVEFDDQGALHSRQAKRDLLTHVKNLGQQTPLLIVVFAHGWKHNASRSDTNVASFAEELRRIAIEDRYACGTASACAQRRVVGIYLGWRGLSATVEPFRSLSFWSRKNRAHRVGADGVTEVLLDLGDIQRNMPESFGDNSRRVITGHSFGAAMIYNATQHILLRDSFYRNNGSIPRSVGDLVILVNPAFEAMRFESLWARMHDQQFSATQRPILAIFTSEADVATKRAFPVGRAFGTIFQSHVSPEQKRKNRTAVGHYDGFQTHELTLEDGADGGTAPLPGYNEYRCSWNSYQQTETSWPLGPIVLSRVGDSLEPAHRLNPYYNVRVDRGLIGDHNDIWGKGFGRFLYRFVAVQASRRLDGC